MKTDKVKRAEGRTVPWETPWYWKVLGFGLPFVVIGLIVSLGIYLDWAEKKKMEAACAPGVLEFGQREKVLCRDGERLFIQEIGK